MAMVRRPTYLARHHSVSYDERESHAEDELHAAYELACADASAWPPAVAGKRKSAPFCFSVLSFCSSIIDKVEAGDPQRPCFAAGPPFYAASLDRQVRLAICVFV